MGTKMAPSYANLFMHDLEMEFLSKEARKPTLWVRFIDDIFIIWEHGESYLDQFLTSLNKVNKHIKFTIEKSTLHVPFLDTTVFVENGELLTKLYTKPTDAHLYLRYDSCHPIACKTGIPKSQFQRLKRLHTKESDYQLASDQLSRQLEARGYPSNIIKSARDYVDKSTNITKNIKSKDDSIVFITEYNPRLPNIKKILERHKHILSENATTAPLAEKRILVAYQRPASIRDRLIRTDLVITSNPFIGSQPCGKKCNTCPFMTRAKTFKSSITNKEYKIRGSLNCETTNVVYLITCKKCQIQYVGTTGNSINTRFTGHKCNINKNTNTTVGIHFNQNCKLRHQITPI